MSEPRAILDEERPFVPCDARADDDRTILALGAQSWIAADDTEVSDER